MFNASTRRLVVTFSLSLPVICLASFKFKITTHFAFILRSECSHCDCRLVGLPCSDYSVRSLCFTGSIPVLRVMYLVLHLQLQLLGYSDIIQDSSCPFGMLELEVDLQHACMYVVHTWY
jgi:hypothetical protein